MHFILGAILLAVAIDNSQACSCSYRHPQETFCNADFVMRVRLRGEGEIIYKKTEKITWDEETNSNKTTVHRYPLHRQYNVVIRRMFKVNDNTLGLNMNSTVTQLHTATEDSLCGKELEGHTHYLVTGHFRNDQLIISLCDWVQRWPWVSKVQRKYLSLLYQPNCDCKVRNTWFDSQDDPELNMDKTCSWSPGSKQAECYARNSACVHDKNSTTGGCKWNRNKHLKLCRSKAKTGRMEP